MGHTHRDQLPKSLPESPPKSGVILKADHGGHAPDFHAPKLEKNIFILNLESEPGESAKKSDNFDRIFNLIESENYTEISEQKKYPEHGKKI